MWEGPPPICDDGENVISNGSALATVDPRYQPWLKLVGLLWQFDIINIDYKKHSFTLGFQNLAWPGKPPPIKGHWIQLAIASLTLDYIEVIPIARKKRA